MIAKVCVEYVILSNCVLVCVRGSNVTEVGICQSCRQRKEVVDHASETGFSHTVVKVSHCKIDRGSAQVSSYRGALECTIQCCGRILFSSL